jgi:RNA polymerase sigma factor (sigma-70 family)
MVSTEVMTEIPADLFRYAEKLACKKAKRLAGHYGWIKADWEDIKQELLMDVLARWPAFDPARSEPKAFIGGVIKNCIATLIEAQMAGMRDYRKRGPSLNVVVGVDEYGDPIELGDLQGDPVDDHAHRESEADIETLLDGLPDDLRRACEMIRWGSSVAEAARAIGMPLSTLRDRLAALGDRLDRLDWA